MSNVIDFKLTEKRSNKISNDDIVYKLYAKGVCKYNPHKHENEYYEGHIIQIPKECFEKHKFYKVGA